MDVLESPLEALVFKYLRFGFLTTINGFWTWVAVLTAAVSFWRIKAVDSHYHPHKSGDSHSFSEQRTDAASEDSQLLLESSKKPAPASSCTTTFSTVEDDGTVKGKLTEYYFNDDDGNGESTLIGGWSDLVCSWESWEGTPVIRTGDLSLYRHQDLTVLNGSVVRLWDDVKRRCSPSVGVSW